MIGKRLNDVILVTLKDKSSLIDGTNEIAITLIKKPELDLTEIVGMKWGGGAVTESGISKESAYTKIFWQEIIAKQESVDDWKDGLWKPKTKDQKAILGNYTESDLVEVNFNHSVGDITYVNHEEKLVIIEIKRTGTVYMLATGISKAGKDANWTYIAKDVVNTTVWVGGEKYIVGEYIPSLKLVMDIVKEHCWKLLGTKMEIT